MLLFTRPRLAVSSLYDSKKRNIVESPVQHWLMINAERSPNVHDVSLLHRCRSVEPRLHSSKKIHETHGQSVQLQWVVDFEISQNSTNSFVSQLCKSTIPPHIYLPKQQRRRRRRLVIAYGGPITAGDLMPALKSASRVPLRTVTSISNGLHYLCMIPT